MILEDEVRIGNKEINALLNMAYDQQFVLVFVGQLNSMFRSQKAFNHYLAQGNFMSSHLCSHFMNYLGGVDRLVLVARFIDSFFQYQED